MRGTVRVPGDKSISHRALVVAALAAGQSRIAGLNVGRDVLATATCLGGLGVGATIDEANGQAEVEGRGWAGLREPADVLDAGNSGTTIRTLAGICAAVDGTSVLTGDASVRRRPMLRVVAPLRQMGAVIHGRAYGDRAPLAITGGPLDAIDLVTDVASAQVKTAVLLAGLRARGTTAVTEPEISRDHTERMLVGAGVELRRIGARVEVPGSQSPVPLQLTVPGDVSAAVFLIVGALIVPGSDLTVEDVGLNETRTGALDVLRAMGADIDVETERDERGEPVGRIRARASDLTGIEIGPQGMATFVDEVPALAVAASQARGTTVLRGAGELRVKESDRLETMAAGLRALGATADATEDGLVIEGPARLHGGEVESHGDHRIAMALAVAGLAAEDRVRVRGWGSVDTSFPGFLEAVGRAQRTRSTR